MTYEQGSGFGNGFYRLDRKIINMEVIKDIGEYTKNQLKKQGYKVKGDIVILNFQMVD